MTEFYKKPIFWVVSSILLVIIILTLFTYFFQPQTISNFLSSVQNKIKPTKIIKPGGCLIFEEKYCSQSEIFEWTFEGQTYKFVAFKQLPPQTPIFSTEKGYLASGKASDPFAGHHADVRDLQDPTSTDFSFEGYFQMVAKDGGVQKDEVIAQTTEVTGKKIFGRYSLVVGVTRLNPNGKGFITDENLFQKISPR